MITKPKMTSKTTSSTVNRNVRTTSEPAQTRKITQQQIAERAYSIYLSGKGGNSIENWLRAERELQSETQRTSNR